MSPHGISTSAIVTDYTPRTHYVHPSRSYTTYTMVQRRQALVAASVLCIEYRLVVGNVR